MREIVKVFLVAVIFLSGAAAEVSSQEQTATASSQNVIKESFDGEDPSLMLGGQIDLRSNSASWQIYVADGKLLMENRKDPQSLQYNDIAWVRFPESEVITSTENLVISAIVEANNIGNGGVGILVGSGKAGTYLVFSVDGQGSFHILKKDGRKLRSMHSAKHAAIAVGAPNQLTFEVRGAHVVFFANGTEIIQVPYMKRMASTLQSKGQAGIGLAAFGIGKFVFESVEITKAN